MVAVLHVVVPDYGRNGVSISFRLLFVTSCHGHRGRLLTRTLAGSRRAVNRRSMSIRLPAANEGRRERSVNSLVPQAAMMSLQLVCVIVHSLASAIIVWSTDRGTGAARPTQLKPDTLGGPETVGSLAKHAIAQFAPIRRAVSSHVGEKCDDCLCGGRSSRVPTTQPGAAPSHDDPCHVVLPRRALRRIGFLERCSEAIPATSPDANGRAVAGMVLWRRRSVCMHGSHGAGFTDPRAAVEAVVVWKCPVHRRRACGARRVGNSRSTKLLQRAGMN
jgi:hypothetical protein